jgi:hypothetical protein
VICEYNHVVLNPLDAIIFKKALFVSFSHTVAVYFTTHLLNGLFGFCRSNILFCIDGYIGKDTFPMAVFIAFVSSVLFINSICAVLIADGFLDWKCFDKLAMFCFSKRIKYKLCDINLLVVFNRFLKFMMITKMNYG